MSAEDAALGKLQRPRNGAQPYCTDQQQHAAGQGIGKIDARSANRLGRALVGDQRVGGQRQHFVEDHEGKQVAGQRQADGSGDTEAEKTEEAASVRCVLQVTDRINRGDQPEHGRQGDEQHRQLIGMQYQVEARRQCPACFEYAFVEDAPDHHPTSTSFATAPSRFRAVRERWSPRAAGR